MTNDVMKKGSIFLFNDVIIVAKCVVSNRRYVGEMCFKLNEVKLVKQGTILQIADSFELGKHSISILFYLHFSFPYSQKNRFWLLYTELEIELEDVSIANIWEKYIVYWSEYKGEEDDDKDDKAAPREEVSRLLVKTRTVSYTLPPDDVPDQFI